MFVSWGRLGVPFIILFVYNCWSSRMAELMLYYSTLPYICKGGISASTICYPYRYILVV